MYMEKVFGFQIIFFLHGIELLQCTHKHEQMIDLNLPFL